LAHPIFLWAKENYGSSAIPKWNFHKILINKDGKIQDTYSSLTKPTSKKITDEIEKILNIE
jgi:glutathione peroxidase